MAYLLTDADCLYNLSQALTQASCCDWHSPPAIGTDMVTRPGICAASHTIINQNQPPPPPSADFDVSATVLKKNSWQSQIDGVICTLNNNKSMTVRCTCNNKLGQINCCFQWNEAITMFFGHTGFKRESSVTVSNVYKYYLLANNDLHK